MSKTPSGRVPAKIINEDIQAFHGLATIQGYAPHDPDLTLEAITATYEELMADRAALVRAQIALDVIRDKIGTTEQRFHGQMRGSKDAVRGQYGDDSNELAAMGLKKASEKKRGSGRGKPAEE